MIPNFLTVEETVKLWGLSSSPPPAAPQLIIGLELKGVLFDPEQEHPVLLEKSLGRLVRTLFEADAFAVVMSDDWPEYRTLCKLGTLLGSELVQMLAENQPRWAPQLTVGVHAPNWEYPVYTRAVTRAGRAMEWLLKSGRLLQFPGGKSRKLQLQACLVPGEERSFERDPLVPEEWYEGLVYCDAKHGCGVKQDAILRHRLGLKPSQEWHDHLRQSMVGP